ncbi:hypothetical protein HJC23_005565 [Cyclotella cryptica]|uniref:Pentacotripeptide-repeat region of PRORP domain-containing protein n=1 Tax=Cyclotella cryptica TaxID=29204 RepID=A0ABD3PWY5_9STRA|eukprot:CCRYP_010670-RA/>CCRYP_010670-RA protein AED:0.01 eAED:-0.00 QI:0/-1/0/1/-1/1/1/0/632
MRSQKRNPVILAGALFVSPFAAAAFRPPMPLERAPAAPLRTARGSSVLPNADRQVSPIDDSFTRSDSVVKSCNGMMQDMASSRKKATQDVGNDRKKSNSRRNNVAMSDPVFVRKRTDTLLGLTANGLSKHDGEGTLDNKSGSIKADKKTFDWLIDAWAYSGEPDSSEMALALLTRMEELSSVHSSDNDTDFTKISPDSKTYTKVINAIALSGKFDAGEQAEAILNKMIDGSNNLRPNTLTYTFVIDAYSRSKSAQSPFHAQRLVEKMEELRAQGDAHVRPTARAWNSVIQAWSRQSAAAADACLDIMETLADTTGNEEVRPNSYNCNTVISAWAKSGEPGAASRAEKILEKMERMYATSGDERFKPRTETYNAIIDAWAKSGEVDAPNRAELLLGYMLELYETGHNTAAKPNVRSFNSVMNAWAKSGDVYAPEKAADILKRMEQLERSELKVSPDATSFATAINAYARSLNYGKADAAYQLFLHMNNLYDLSGKESLRPNNIVYNSVLNACAFTIGDMEEQCRAIEIANSVFTAMRASQFCNPDDVTYGTYLKVIANQMPPGKQRDKVLRAIFEKAVQDGMVGSFVLRQLKDVGLDKVGYEKLLERESMNDMSLEDLPSSWTCNVIDERGGQ